MNVKNSLSCNMGRAWLNVAMLQVDGSTEQSTMFQFAGWSQMIPKEVKI